MNRKDYSQNSKEDILFLGQEWKVEVAINSKK